MEAKIRRGRILREVLKQDRLSPLPIEFQLAWLTAFTNGLFDERAPASIPALLDHLDACVKGGELTLNHRDEEWTEAVARWVKAQRST